MAVEIGLNPGDFNSCPGYIDGLDAERSRAGR
jgi:hypothetical protein